MKPLFGLLVIALLGSTLYGCTSYTTPASSIANLTPFPSPAPQPTPDIGSLWGRYSSDVGDWLDLLRNGVAYYAAKRFGVERDTYSIERGQIVFSGPECNHAAGAYQWSMDQGFLQLTALNDPCPSRAGMLSDMLRRLPQQFPFAAVQWSKPINQAAIDHAAMDSAGNFYVTDGNGGFYKYNADGRPAAAWPNALTYTTGIAVNAAGDIYVANFDDATVHEFDPGGKPLRSWSVGGGTDGPSALAIDSQGNVYVVMRRVHDQYVDKYSATGTLLGSWADTGNGDGELGAGFKTGPEGITVDASANVYVADTLNNRIVKFDPNGKFLFSITGDGARFLFQPTTIAVDSKGNVYTISNQAIWKFSSAGDFLGEWFVPYAGNLLVDSKDNLWLIGQSIVKIAMGAAG